MEPYQAPPAAGGTQHGPGSVRITMDDAPEPQKQKSSHGMKYNAKNTNSMVRQKLRSLDTNQDGTLDEAELIRGIEELVQETRMRKMFMFLALGLFLVVLILIGAIGGMTYGIIEATKDTKISGTVLVTSDSKSAVVQTANYDMTVQDGVLVSRGANGTSNSTAAVLRAASYTTQQAFTSAVDIKALMEMKYFYVKSTEAELALTVLGVGRVPKAGSVYGTVVKILTLAGTIVLDDRMISFTEDMAPIFSEAGFVVDVKHRRLLGVYDILGFFEYIKDLEVFNLPPNEPKPALPSGDFQMVLKVWEPCVLDYDGVPENRCHYTPGHATVNGTKSNSTSGRHLLGGANFIVLQGVETLSDGSDYMASVETVTRMGSKVKTVYEYAGFPDMVKIEVLDETTKNITSWQTYKPRENYGVSTTPYWCNYFSLPPTFFDKYTTKNTSGVTFTFVGYATTMGTPSRHFKLVVPQPPDADGSAQPPMTVDYYDNADTHYPLFFDFYHHMGGHIMVHVQTFAMLNSTNRPSTDFMAVPSKSWCDDYKSKPDEIPRIGSAYTVPPQPEDALITNGPHGNATVVVATNTTVATTGRRRQLLSVDPETGKPKHHGGSRGQAYLYDPYFHPDRPWQSNLYNQTMREHRRRLEEQTCFNEDTISVPLGFCDFTIGGVFPPYGFLFEFECGGAIPALPVIIVTGGGSINTCSQEVQGCLNVKLSLLPFGTNKAVAYVKEKLGLEDLSLLSICAGYSWKDKQGYAKGTYSGPPLYLWVIKAEIAGTLKFDSEVTFWDQVGMEVFAGIDFGFWSSYTSLGTVIFAKDYYIRGEASTAAANANPTITNYVGDITPGVGHWGDWTGNSFCYTQSLEGTATGTAVRGFRVRMESDSANDDTALNAISFLCADNSEIMPTEGYWGDWTQWAMCPQDEYITGAVMRIESTGGDDTSANSLQLMCSKGTKLQPHNGYWGDWGQWVWCPTNTFVCGLKVRMEAQQGDGDDTSLNGVTLFCCKPEIDDGKSYPPPAPGITSG